MILHTSAGVRTLPQDKALARWMNSLNRQGN